MTNKCTHCGKKAKYCVEEETTTVYRLFKFNGKDSDLQDVWDNNEEMTTYYCEKCAEKEDLI